MSEIVEIGKDTVNLTVVDNNVSLNVTTSQISLETASVGPQGIQGVTGATGPAGPTGPGVAAGGTTGKVLAKTADEDYVTGWITPNAGTVTSITASSPLTGGVITSTGTIGIADIANADISATAGIVDTKLATISTAGKVSGTAITSGAITTTGGINVTGGGQGIRATGSAGYLESSTYIQTLQFIAGKTSPATAGSVLITGSTSGTATLNVPATAGGTHTFPATGGTVVNSATTSLPNVTSASSLATVGTIGSGTWQGGIIQPAYGGTGSTYGALMVGHSQLNAAATKNANDTTPEAVFRTGTANSTIQYFNVDADTMYFFEGFIQINKTSTSSVINTSLLYVNTGNTSAVTGGEQSARLQVQYATSSALIGVGVASATATAAASATSAITTIYCTLRGFIRTHATTAGRINIAQWLDTAGASAPSWNQGSYINLYKVGTGNAQNFGNWTS